MDTPPGQLLAACRNSNPRNGLTRDLNILRHRTVMNFNLLGVVQQRASSLEHVTQHADMDSVRPHSEMVVLPVPEKVQMRHRVPVLGPTRQQTEMYLFKMAKQKLNKLEQLR